MDHAIEIQRIIDDLKEDKTVNPKWRNKVIARLEEIQPWCLMLYETPSFDILPAEPVDTTYDGYNPNNTTLVNQIPESMRQFVDPNRLQPPQGQ